MTKEQAERILLEFIASIALKHADYMVLLNAIQTLKKQDQQ